MPSTIDPVLLWDFVDMPHRPLSITSELPELPGVYIVYQDEDVLYVGKTHNLAQRWYSHHRQTQFATFGPEVELAWRVLPASDAAILHAYEDRLITALKPRLNWKRFEGGTSQTRRTGQRLKSCRKAQGLTLAQVALAFGVTEASMSRYEQGKVSISYIHYSKIASILGTTVRDLFPDFYEVPSDNDEAKE